MEATGNPRFVAVESGQSLLATPVGLEHQHPKTPASAYHRRNSRNTTEDAVESVELKNNVVDLEASQPGTPGTPQHIDTKPSATFPYMNRWRLVVLCCISFTSGMFDSAPGALIPIIQEYYRKPDGKSQDYAITSLIFVGAALGFIITATFVTSLRARFGVAKAVFLGQVIVVCGYLPLVCAAPFPAIPVGFFFVGLGSAIQLALGNVFCGSLSDGTIALGYMHGSYGFGGTVGPLVANSLVTFGKQTWSRFYLIPLGLTVIWAFVVAWAFWDYEKEPANNSNADEAVENPAAAGIHGMFSALGSRVVILGAAFIFAYQGAEVSISGWVVEDLLKRWTGAQQKEVGYVTVGFWAGITLGRSPLMTYPAQRIGEKRFVVGVVVGAGIFELLVWFVPNLIGNAVSVAIVGLLLGPVYPCAATLFLHNMDEHEKTSGMSVISAFGSSGGAVAPFTTGLLAQVAGPFVLHPVAISLFCVMMGCWYGMPGKSKKRD